MTVFQYKDTTFDCRGVGPDGDWGQGIITISLTQHGELGSEFIDADAITISLTVHGTDYTSTVIDADSIDITLTIPTDENDIFTVATKNNWIAWSRIGYLDFDIDHSNEAGERPAEWAGNIYDILKLNNSVIVYGENGIAQMSPHEVIWDYKQLLNLGTLGRSAQVSNVGQSNHWFVDASGELWEVGEGLRKIGYKEFLSDLGSDTVLSYDEANQLLYICDGTTGYVYNIAERSLGEWVPTISGYAYRDGTTYTFASAAISNPSISFTTEILDFGTRKPKTIERVEVGTDLAQTMDVAIKFRKDHAGSWTTTPWVTVTPRGEAFLCCFGIEFQIKFRVQTYTSLALDYLKIAGQVHDFGFLDTIRMER